MKPLTTKNLSSTLGVAHGFFTREGGVSEGIYAGLNCGPGSRDNPQHVRENRARVARHMRGTGAPLCSLYQIHSAKAVRLLEPWTQENAPQADAIVTTARGVVLGVLTADCVPILLADAQAGVIAVAHAGWKGALGGIVEATLQEMEKAGAVRAHIMAAIGPSIAQQSYEVGPELREAFTAQNARYDCYFAVNAAGRYQLDMQGFVAQRLQEAGVMQQEIVAEDTYSQPQRFYSYRRATHAQEPDYGRQISAIMLTP